jgi:hypothetical protein
MACPTCGFDAPADHAFCAGCGTPLADLPIAVDYDADRTYDAGTETTLDLVLRNLGRTAVLRGHVEATFRAQLLSRDLSAAVPPGGQADLHLPGVLAPKGVDALLVAVSVVGVRDGTDPFACRGEFRARVTPARDKTKVRIVNIHGDKNIVDQAKFGVEERTPRESGGPRWTAVRLVPDPARLAGFIPPGTSLVVVDEISELPFPLGDAPVRFGRKRETNDVVVRVPGDEQATVDRVSRNHFTITLRAGRLFVGDLSTPGTMVNGARIDRESPLKSGDRVAIAGVAEYRLELDRAAGGVSRVLLIRTR